MRSAIFFFLLFLGAKKSLYDVLGVSKSATEQEIKSKYRKMAVKMHPDKNKDNPKASENFAEITHAYQVLSDAGKRKNYDVYGDEGTSSGGGGGGGGFNPFDLFGSGGFSFQSGFGGGDEYEENGDGRAENITYKLSVDLSDVCVGLEKEMKITRQVRCKKCDGTGAKSKSDLFRCKKCGGKGSTIVERTIGGIFVQQIRMPCQDCAGIGTRVKVKCQECHGKKIVSEATNLVIKIPKGTEEGKRLVFSGMANEAVNGAAGDLIFIITISEDPKFKRNGKNLETVVRLTLGEALLGFKKTILLPSKEKFVIKRESVVQPEEKEEFYGRGIPSQGLFSKSGSLFVVYKVSIPKTFSDRKKRLLESALREDVKDEL